MPYVLLGNGAVARHFLERRRAPKAPALVVLNEPARQRDADAIRAAASAAGAPVIEWSDAGRAELLKRLRADQSLWLLSVYFGHVVDEEVLEAAGGRAVNLHASLLPWNRGVHTNVWPIVERTPAGVSLHAMSARVDGGAVLAQSEVRIEPWDTGASLYAKLEDAAFSLLDAGWPDGVRKAWPGVPQAAGGSEHRLRDFLTLDTYDLDGHPEARAFFDLLRARSFPPHAGLRVRLNGVDVDATILLRKLDG